MDTYEARIAPEMERIRRMARNGHSNTAIAERLGFSASEFEELVSSHSELEETLLFAREKVLESVRDALYKRATGYITKVRKTITTESPDGEVTTRTEEIEQEVAPDTKAIAMFLRNADSKYSDSDSQTASIRLKDYKLRERQDERKEWS